jgi:hypothetical protein
MLDRRSGFAAVACLTAALAGCDDKDSEPPGQRGELNAGTFFYLCAGDADAQCDDDAVVSDADETTGAFPPIAVGADLMLNFVRDDAPDAQDFILAAGGETFITGVDTTFTTHKAGIVALVATDGSSYPHDLVHVRVVEATGLRVSQATTTEQTVDELEAGAQIDVSGNDVEIDLSGSVTLTTRTFLRAAPIGADDKILAGTLETTWTSSDPSIVEIVSDDSNNVIEIETGAPGTATVTVQMGELTADVELEVAP